MRGKKTCMSCGKSTGPRTKRCLSCGAGFKIKGKQQKSLTINNITLKDLKTLNNNLPTEIKKELLGLVRVHNSKDEIARRKKYEIKGITWQSKCEKYRIRLTETFMGVKTAECYDNNYMVLVRGLFGWEVIQLKGPWECTRFGNLLEAIVAMLQHKRGQKT